MPETYTPAEAAALWNAHFPGRTPADFGCFAEVTDLLKYGETETGEIIPEESTVWWGIYEHAERVLGIIQ